jgi:hypothetical protein
LWGLASAVIGFGKREREREKKEKWMVVTDTTGNEGENNLTSVLKVPRHCPFVLVSI